MDKNKLLELRLSGMTYEQIGRKVGLSRQRVQQLLSPPKGIRNFVVSKFSGKCNKCGVLVGKSGHVHHSGNSEDTYNNIDHLELLCLSCHRQAHNMDFHKRAKKREFERKKRINNDRIEIIRKLRDEHPDWTYKKIGELLNIDPSQVFRIVKRAKEKSTGG